MRNLILTLAALTVILGAMLAMSRKPPAPVPDFYYINGTEPETVDPHTATGVPEWRIMLGLFEGLTAHDTRTLEVVPGLAESWEVSADGMTYTFHLRDATWSDGTPITGADFVWSVERAIRPSTAAEYSYMLYELPNAELYNTGRLKLFTAGLVCRTPDNPQDCLTLPGTIKDGVTSGPLAVTIVDEFPKYSDDEKDQGKRPARVKIVAQGGVEYWVQPEQLIGPEAGEEAIKVFRHLFGVSAPDPKTVVMKLEHPVPYLLDLLTHHSWWPVPRHAIEKYGHEKWTMPENIVTSGAYTLERWDLNQMLVVRKNPRYYGAATVALERVGYLPIDNRNTAFNIFATGKGNMWSEWYPPPIVDQVRAQPFYHETSQLGVYYYRVNTTRKPFNDPRVRRALMLAIDRDYLVKYVMRGGEPKATQFVPPGIPGYEGAPCPDFNPDEARKLLAAAGYPGGKGFPPFEIQFNRDDVHQKMAESVQNMWKEELGIDVRLLAQEWKVYLSTQNELDYDVGRAAWTGDYVDPNTFLSLFITGGGNNKTGWGNRDYDRLLKEANMMTDPVARAAKLRRVEEILLDELPILPIYHYVNHDLFHGDKWGGIHGNLIHEINPKNIRPLKPGESDPYLLAPARSESHH